MFFIYNYLLYSLKNIPIIEKKKWKMWTVIKIHIDMYLLLVTLAQPVFIFLISFINK